MPTIDLYHYARSETLDAISEEGLKTGSSYFAINAPSRSTAVYLWQSPDFDVMGYHDNPRYIGLRARVDQARCKIAPMELIAAAYANLKGQYRMPMNPELSQKLVDAYEKAAVSIYDYTTGQFRAPEVLVQGAIDPDDIATFRTAEIGPRGQENRRVYSARWTERLIHLLNIQRTRMTLQELTEAALHRGAAVRVAKHEDATSYLETYLLVEPSEFFTIEKED